jgi:hypothetical protein
MAYTIIYAPQFRRHLRSIERKFYSLIRDTDEVERFKMAYSTQLQTILARGRQEIAEGKGLNHEEFWANLDDEEES